ncbi:hypothetical protein JCM21714_3965 [Gracilibacillus boraciitolerans JCM 21714]|uniref:Renal dipeptidase n=1 Tax=Gracilibacillus boraciitolerans JCM 21714 TaxID=1298598 RepID=W4VMX3_9BACI|nr:nucleotidyltransferase family protein [Gracilibacillus boraciitolerans]GAE94775.1 hypothetical protein JCM21714_3965 [Gracilibacillus boraciitolerans JCM 21714]
MQINKLELSSLSKELRLILAIIKIDNVSDYLKENSELLDDIDWKEFIYLAKHHRVYPIIYEKVSTKGIINIPKVVIDTLNHLYSRNTVNMLTLTAELTTVTQTLKNNNIPSLVLKGPVLADYLYGDVSKRTSKDIDLLVPHYKIEQSEELLYSLGYQLEFHGPRILNDWKVKLHHLSFFHPTKHIQVEIHMNLNPDMGSEPKFKDLWMRKNTSYIADIPIYFLGNEDLFFHLVTHGGAKHAWFRLRWLIDIDKMVTKEFNYTILLNLLNKYEANRSYGQAMILCASLFDTKVKKEFQELISENSDQKKLSQQALYFINRGLIPHSQENSKAFFNEYINYLNTLRTKRQNVLMIMNRMYPSSKDAIALPLPKPLHFLYFPLRPFIWSYRKMKKIQ